MRLKLNSRAERVETRKEGGKEERDDVDERREETRLQENSAERGREGEGGKASKAAASRLEAHFQSETAAPP